MITTCIFDLDGTLVDSLADLANACNTVLKQYGFSSHPLDKYRTFVGDGVDVLITRAVPKEYCHLVKEMRVLFDQVYIAHCLEKTVPYVGVKELIEHLDNHGIHLAVVTNKPDMIAKKIVTALFSNRFSYIYGNSPSYPRKPNPFLIHQVIRDFGVTKEEVLYIGDSDVDIFTGKNANVKTIGVSWGFRGKQELLDSGANFVVDKASEIGDIVYDSNQ